MTRVLELDRDDEVVRELLSPFTNVQPVALRSRAAVRRSRRPRMLLAAAAAVVVLVFASLATAGAFNFGPLHGALISPTPPTLTTSATSTLACNLIGKTAGQAEASLRQSGFQIEWRFQHWGTQVAQSSNKSTPGAVTGGYATAPDTVPANSIVWDIGADTRSPNTLFVFVQAPSDPNAPTVAPPNCQAG
jgi:hypothetical protein